MYEIGGHAVTQSKSNNNHAAQSSRYYISFPFKTDATNRAAAEILLNGVAEVQVPEGVEPESAGWVEELGCRRYRAE